MVYVHLEVILIIESMAAENLDSKIFQKIVKNGDFTIDI